MSRELSHWLKLVGFGPLCFQLGDLLKVELDQVADLFDFYAAWVSHGDPLIYLQLFNQSFTITHILLQFLTVLARSVELD